jgi:hypothetical protein
MLYGLLDRRILLTDQVFLANKGQLLQSDNNKVQENGERDSMRVGFICTLV